MAHNGFVGFFQAARIRSSSSLWLGIVHPLHHRPLPQPGARARPDLHLPQHRRLHLPSDRLHDRQYERKPLRVGLIPGGTPESIVFISFYFIILDTLEIPSGPVEDHPGRVLARPPRLSEGIDPLQSDSRSWRISAGSSGGPPASLRRSRTNVDPRGADHKEKTAVKIYINK